MSKKIMGEDGNVYQMKKPFYKKVWFWILAVVVVFGIAGMSGSGDKRETTDKDASSSQSGTNSGTQKTAESKKTADTHKIGDTFDVGKMVYKVVGKTTAAQVGGEYSNTQAKDVYLVLDVEIKNNGDKPITVSDSFFKLFRGKTEYSSDSSASLMANLTDTGDDLFYTKLNPGSSASGKVIFDITQETIDAPELQLQAQTGAFGTETGRVSLNQ